MSWALFALCFSVPVCAEVNRTHNVSNAILGDAAVPSDMFADNEQILPANEVPENPNNKFMSKVTTVIFISLSMPERELENLFNQASGRNDVVFLYRGFVDGYADKKTMPFMAKQQQRFAKNKKPAPHVMLDPESFETYQVTKVPAILHKNKDGSWYMAQGGLNINSAIAAIERHQYKLPLSRQWAVIEPNQIEFQKKITVAHHKRTLKAREEKRIKELEEDFEGRVELPWSSVTKTDTFAPFYTVPIDIINPKDQTTIAQKGTKINILGNDFNGKRIFLFIDGRDDWQVAFADEIHKKRPDTYIFYTKRGKIGEKFPAAPLDTTIADRLQVKVVPTLLQQKAINLNGVFINANNFREPYDEKNE